ncbi:hypothetical protein C9I92_13100 [Photobacterium ganghwense]|uniref:alpha/beta hydrolase family protein n=1 Tax=Photobacterium ganghwense TaxID=320778 RepID=UPI00069CC359|nr:hypothetical protein [Photobacterium ganghwense]PSU08448.1 hypothetical protein C9I92_13100 [Photobacterium ganghwense]
MRFVFRLFVVLLIIISPFSNAYEVGFDYANVPSSIENNGFPMVVFYPTSSEPKVVELGPFKLNVAVEGEILKGKYPLVIVSHGSGGSNLSYKDIAISLAKSGFIVGMPLHPQNNYMDNTLEGSVTNYTNRPKHITLAIDKLLNTSGLNTYIDSDKIAVLGHSVGGYATIAAAGGVGDTSSLIEICKNNPLLTDPYCTPVRDGSMMKTVIKSTKDPRIKAIIIMAPVGILFSTEGSLNDVDIPVLLLKAENDKEVTEPYNADVIEKGLPNKQKLISIMISNAGHYSFLTSFPDFLKSELGLIAEDPNGFNREEFQEKLGTIIVDYLKGVLK